MTTLAAPPHNLPRQLTSFVGRGPELAALQQWLELSLPTVGTHSRASLQSPGLSENSGEVTGPGIRLLTLVGPAGSGKTRLALQAAQTIYDLQVSNDGQRQPPPIPDPQRQFPDGVWLVELAGLQAGELVPFAVASLFTLRDEPDQTLTDTLIDSLRDKSLLLILDNCEHLGEACAVLATRLLYACPALRILATSQTPLGVSGETVWTVGPPPPQDAAQLFIERAQAVAPDFAPQADTRKLIDQICRRLDHSPLAIELAAARVKALTPQQIVARLDDVFRLLTRGASVALPRHQTLQAALDWSYGLLGPAEKSVLARLAVFAGGFTAEAAEQVAGDASLGAADVRGVLYSLVEKSLVLAVMDHGTGERRYRLLETVRQYGGQRLRVAGEVAVTQARHALVYLSLAERAEQELQSPAQRVWLDRLEADHDNLRVALTWARDHAPETLARLSAALWRFWYVRGHLSEARGWLDQAVALSETIPPSVQARVLHAAGTIAHEVNDYATARVYFERSLALKRELGDNHSLGATLNNLGNLAMDQGDFAAARPLHEESLALWREHGDQAAQALTMSNLAWGALAVGDLGRARMLSEAGLRLKRDLGATWQTAVGLNDLGMIALQQGDLATAQTASAEALILSTELGDKRGMGQALETHGGIALAQGDLTTALAHLQASLTLRWELRDRRSSAVCLQRLARLAQRQGQAERAARLLGAADGLRETIQAPLPPVEQIEDERLRGQLVEMLGEDGFRLAWQAGRTLAPDQAIAYALGETTNGRQQTTGSGPQTADCGPQPDTTARIAVPDAPSALSTPPSALTTLHVEVAPAWLRLQALGAVRVWRGDVEVGASEWTYARAPELLFYLLTHGPRTRQQIGEVFWPKATPTQLRQNLGAVLRHLRRALGRQEWIIYQDDVYSFNREWPYWYDVDVLEKGLREERDAREKKEIQAISQSSLSSFSALLSLYQGDFLAGVPSEWAVQRREDLQRQFLDAALRLAGAFAEQGQTAEAGAAYQRALAHAPYLQSAQRGWLRCLVRQGQRDAAVQYIETLLAAPTRASPSTDAETLRLIEQVRRGEAI